VVLPQNVLTHVPGAPWWRAGVLYQVYPRSFADSNGDGIGDLRGLIDRLDYLPSPNRDWGYDVADYTGVHPDLGTLADLDRLIAEAGGRDIRILLDLVPNHTSDQHPWFEHEHRDWYVWADRPTNWRSVFGGSAWEWDEREHRHFLHSFLPEMPDLNWQLPAVLQEFDRILRFWLDRGVAGFRIDVVHRTVKDVRLRDAVGRWRQLADSYDPQRLLLGETYVMDVREMAAFYGAGADELHLAFNFPFVRAGLGAAALRRVVELTEQALPQASWPVWTLSNHDHPRFPTRWCAGDERRVRCALLVLLTLRGTPVLYYGDELGLSDGPVPDPPLDPARPPRDGCRTPMPWREEPWPRSWLPMGDTSRNVADQRADSGSTLAFCRRLIALRRGFSGEAYETLPAPPGLWAWRRGGATVAVNLSDRAGHVAGIEGSVRISTDGSRDGEMVSGRLRLEPWTGLVVGTMES
jgi:alpha-glucosidase